MAPDLGNVSLSAVRPGPVDAAQVGVFTDGNATAARRQAGEVAHALVTVGGSREALEHEADRIAEGFR